MSEDPILTTSEEMCTVHRKTTHQQFHIRHLCTTHFDGYACRFGTCTTRPLFHKMNNYFYQTNLINYLKSECEPEHCFGIIDICAATS